jgi:type I restriction enzyme S subunit
MTVKLPSPIEQRAIASILGSLDDRLDLNRCMNQTLEAMAQALFKSWFVDFDPVRAKLDGQPSAAIDAELASLFPTTLTASALGPVPTGWRVVPIGEVTRVVGGSTPSTGNPDYWRDGSLPWATPKDLSGLPVPALLDTERKITEAGLEQISSGLLPKGTVLLSSRAPIGYLAISEVPVAINQGFIAIVCDGELPNHYVLRWAQASIEAIKARANGTTFLEVSKASFRPISVLVPAKDVLSAFIRQVEPLHQRVVANLRESQTLAAIRDSLLPKLLSGEIRVKDAEKAVAAAL